MKAEDKEPKMDAEDLEQPRGLKRSHTGIYYGIALDALGMAEKAFKIGNDAAKHREGPSTPDKDHRVVRVLVADRARQQYVATAIVFSALCTEALINFALDAKLSKFFVVGLDKLDTPTKWVVGLLLAYSHELKCDAPLVHNIKKLAALRNRLAHAKPRTIVDNDLNVMPDDTAAIEMARFAVNTAKQAIACLHQIDPALPEWGDPRLKPELH